MDGMKKDDAEVTSAKLALLPGHHCDESLHFVKLYLLKTRGLALHRRTVGTRRRLYAYKTVMESSYIDWASINRNVSTDFGWETKRQADQLLFLFSAGPGSAWNTLRSTSRGSLPLFCSLSHLTE